MDISGINNKYNENTLSNTKQKVEDDAFQKRLESAFQKKDEAELKKVCKDFEGILLNMMFKSMKATVPKSEFLQRDPGKEVYDSMMDDKLMEEVSKSSGVGLADVLYKQLSRQMKNTYKVVDKPK